MNIKIKTTFNNFVIVSSICLGSLAFNAQASIPTTKNQSLTSGGPSFCTQNPIQGKTCMPIYNTTPDILKISNLKVDFHKVNPGNIVEWITNEAVYSQHNVTISDINSGKEIYNGVIKNYLGLVCEMDKTSQQKIVCLPWKEHY